MEKENPFKKVGHPPKEVPEALKQKVMKEVASVKLLMDFAVLFTSNYKNTLDGLFLTKHTLKKNK
ncbi:hypothetical protein [Patiriisocius sp. Uisw_017]|jgi:hypothetical protein|uniref:hypothetical protein n=1 Tax=Patiriisocius sp. Uisw_017 TaxID=3230968 RepID=UPI0039EBB25E